MFRVRQTVEYIETISVPFASPNATCCYLFDAKSTYLYIVICEFHIGCESGASSKRNPPTVPTKFIDR